MRTLLLLLLPLPYADSRGSAVLLRQEVLDLRIGGGAGGLAGGLGRPAAGWRRRRETQNEKERRPMLRTFHT